MPTPNLTAALRRLAPDDIPDGELLARYVREQDEAAFAELVSRHGGMVRTVCRRVLRNDADADDATQATFLILVRKASYIRDRNGLANWLFGVAHNVALKARQTRARRQKRESDVPPRSPKAVTSDFAELLHAELTKLPAASRGVIVLCDLEQRTLADAARVLGIPTGTVASRLARGRDQLAKRLRRCGLSVSGGLVATLSGESATAAVMFDPAALEADIHTLANEVTRTMFTTARITRRAALMGLLVTLGGGMLLLRSEAKEPAPRVAQRNAPVPKAKQPDPKEVLDAAKKATDEIEDKEVRLNCLVGIAAGYARSGDKKTAKNVFESAIRLADSDDPKLKGQMRWIAGTMGQAGLGSEAVDLLRPLAENPRQTGVWWIFAGWLRNTGNLDTLANLVDLSTGDEKDRCLATLATEQALTGRRDLAEKTIAGMKADLPRALALAELTIAHHKAKDTKAAAKSLAAAAAAKDRGTRAGGPYSDEILPALTLTRAYAVMGDMKAARAVAEAMPRGNERERALSDMVSLEVSLAHLEAGNRQAALNALRTLETAFHTDRIRAKVVRYDAERGNWKDAATVLDGMTCVYCKVRGRQEMAVQFAKAGKAIEAESALAKATETAGPDGANVKDTEPGYGGLRRHAVLLRYKTLARMGQARAAMEEAAKLANPQDRVPAMMSIARGLLPPMATDWDE